MRMLIGAAALAASLMSFGVQAQERAAQAAAPVSEPCVAPSDERVGKVRWFLGFRQTDDILTAWCRIQMLPGNVRFNVQWPDVGVHHTWTTNFQGGKLPPGQIVKLLQSILPTSDQSGVSDSGKPYSDVVARAVQLQADSSPSGAALGFAAKHPVSRTVVLWDRMALRVRPVVLGGQEFTMTVGFKPNLGMLAMALSGQATDARVKAWRGWMQTGNILRTSCGSYFPDCKSVPEVVDVHLPLLVQAVILEAEGDNLTKAAIEIGNAIYSSNSALTNKNPMASFDVRKGRGGFDLTDGDSSVSFTATGDAGTKKIVIRYEAKVGHGTLRDKFEKFGEVYRAGTSGKEVRPVNPDSTGGL